MNRGGFIGNRYRVKSNNYIVSISLQRIKIAIHMPLKDTKADGVLHYGKYELR